MVKSRIIQEINFSRLSNAAFEKGWGYSRQCVRGFTLVRNIPGDKENIFFINNGLVDTWEFIGLM